MFGQEREPKLELLVQIDTVFGGGERIGGGVGRVAPQKIWLGGGCQTTGQGKAALTLDVVTNWQKIPIAC